MADVENDVKAEASKTVTAAKQVLDRDVSLARTTVVAQQAKAESWLARNAHLVFIAAIVLVVGVVVYIIL